MTAGTGGNERGPLDGVLNWIEHHAPDPGAVRDQPTEPIEVRTVDISEDTWNFWRASSGRALGTARRRANVVGVLVALGLAAPGLLLLPPSWWISTLIYAPAIGLWTRVVTRDHLHRRAFADVADQIRQMLAPLGLQHPSDAELRTLTANSGALIPDEATLLVAEVTADGAVRLVAARYDLAPYARVMMMITMVGLGGAPG